MIKESWAAHYTKKSQPQRAEPKNTFGKRDSRVHASEQSSDGTNSAGKRRGPTAVDCCPGLLDGALPAGGPRSAGCSDWRPQPRVVAIFQDPGPDEPGTGRRSAAGNLVADSSGPAHLQARPAGS